MANAELREQGIDSADLDACATATIADFRGLDVVLTIRVEQRKRCKPIDDLGSRARPRESLQQFLQNEPSSQHDLGAFEGVAQRAYLRGGRAALIAAESKRPDAGIDEHAHERERPAL